MSDRAIIDQSITKNDKRLYDSWIYVKDYNVGMVYFSLREMGISAKYAGILSDYMVQKYKNNEKNLYKMKAVEFWNYIIYDYDNDCK